MLKQCSFLKVAAKKQLTASEQIPFKLFLLKVVCSRIEI